jgi:hypothetical protein
VKAASRSQGLDTLDETRAASLADEGGASAATLEGREQAARDVPQRALAVFCAAAAGFVLLALALRRRF